jgi:hypothetical protein
VDRPSRAQAQRSPQAPAARPQRAQPPQARQQPQRNWSQHTQQQQRQNNWARQAEARQHSRAPQAQRPQNWAGQRTERNRTYTDPRRNTTYRNDRRGPDRDWRAGNGNHRQWNRNWRSDNRYDWQRYRSANRSRYHIGRYYAPYRNYSYRRLSVGFYLDSLFFGSNYWINDPYQYRLPEVYGPYRWVRYYDDVLLVNVYTGEVVDVIYDFFW